MTDKQIIIEDCPHFISGCCQEYLDGVCENHKCDLKIIRELEQKLKAKEQECEAYKMEAEEGKEINAELKAELTRANCQIADDEILQCDMREAIEELKAKNEELKKQYNCYACDTCKGKEDYINLKRHCENAIKSLHNKQAELDQLKAENKHLNDLLNQALKELEKTRETLTEIKEIAEKMKNMQEECGKCMSYTTIQCKQILQKISECEVGND